MPRYSVACTERRTGQPYAVPIEARTAAEAVAKVASAGHIADQAEVLRDALLHQAQPSPAMDPQTAALRQLTQQNAELIAAVKASTASRKRMVRSVVQLLGLGCLIISFFLANVVLMAVGFVICVLSFLL